MRPSIGNRGQLIHRPKPILERVHAHVHVKDGRAKTAARRPSRLVVHCETLEKPARLYVVGGIHLAEDAVDDGRNAANLIEVQDVYVFVRDQGL